MPPQFHHVGCVHHRLVVCQHSCLLAALVDPVATLINRQDCPNTLLLTWEPVLHVWGKLGGAELHRQVLPLPLGVEDPACTVVLTGSVRQEEELLSWLGETQGIYFLELSLSSVECCNPSLY